VTIERRLAAARRRLAAAERAADLAIAWFDVGAGSSAEVEIAEAHATRARADLACLLAALNRALAVADT
jgi:outer membrane protein TolC